MYALLGSGRVARHFEFYLNNLGLIVRTWSRRDPGGEHSLAAALEPATHVLLAVSDSAIAELAARVRHLAPGRRLVHFSGALSVPGVGGAHPLMTFGEKLQALDWYRAIPFAVDAGYRFDELLPGLDNPHYAIEPRLKAEYHALCALAGNSTYVLWRRIGEKFASLGLPGSMLQPYLHQVVNNSGRSGRDFTGPVARGDWSVVRSHLNALEPDLRQAYESYLTLARGAGVAVPEEFL